MTKLLSSLPLVFSKRAYAVETYDNGAMVVTRDRTAVAVGGLHDGLWSLTGGRETIFRAAVRAVGGTFHGGE